MQPRDKRHCFVAFTGCSSVSEGLSDANNLFNFTNVRVTPVDVVTYSSDGGQEGLVGGLVIGKGDGCLRSSEWCVNGGTMTWNCWYGGRCSG